MYYERSVIAYFSLYIFNTHEGIKIRITKRVLYIIGRRWLWINRVKELHADYKIIIEDTRNLIDYL